MNTPDALITYRLDRARETLEDARLLFNQNHLFSTINRLYYALFYCVQALLAARGLSSPKHSGVMANFNREFIKTGVFVKPQERLQVF